MSVKKFFEAFDSAQKICPRPLPVFLSVKCRIFERIACPRREKG